MWIWDETVVSKMCNVEDAFLKQAILINQQIEYIDST